MQRDHEVAWNHVDEILVTLKNSLDYLTLEGTDGKQIDYETQRFA